MLSWLAKQLISWVMSRTRAGHDYPVAHEPALAAGAHGAAAHEPALAAGAQAP